ncbi:unnamed protein product, partial [Amoebophrya sp. A120]|eukprot:GSA120T00011450001.1
MKNVSAVGPTAWQSACTMRRSLRSCLLARQTRFVTTYQHHKF